MLEGMLRTTSAMSRAFLPRLWWYFCLERPSWHSEEVDMCSIYRSSALMKKGIEMNCWVGMCCVQVLKRLKDGVLMMEACKWVEELIMDVPCRP